MREESIFAEALLIAAAERGAYLERVCAGDADLRRQVEAWLAAHAESNVLDRPAVEMAHTGPYAPPAGDSTSSQQPGTLLGAYKLLEKIGEGGMGEVWVAEQSVPIRRRVALKLIKSGMDSKQILARFEAERQALALMDHPHIARVLDAGSTPDGRPFFVMELVKGTPITDFCDARRLSPRERLALFVAVCQAIQHAHTKGIIHRDIKPANVLVELHDDRPVVKVIDFGIAKAVGQQLTEKTIYTGFGTLIGTPAYMAPEQATFNALDVDTRSDVYTLGVLLYELLAGSPPFEPERLRQAALDEVLRLLREEEPPRPSDRLSTSQEKASIAAARQADPERLTKTVRGELDWITMKALEKDRSRRYGTAADLAADVGRYLRDEQVEACPPSWGYRASKFLRKHKAAFTLASTAAALLLVGAVVSGWFAWNESIARRLAADALGQKDDALVEAQRERDAARLAETKEKAARLATRRAFYAQSMTLIPLAWEADEPYRVAQLLNGLRPTPGDVDLRNFEWYYWDRQLHQERRATSIPGDNLSGDWCRVVKRDSKPWDSGLKVVDVASGKVLLTLPERKCVPGKVILNHDGSRLALVRSDPFTEDEWRLLTNDKNAWMIAQAKQQMWLEVWDVTGDAKTPIFSQKSDGGAFLPCATFSPDGKRLLTVEVKLVGKGKVLNQSSDLTLRVWDLDGKAAKPIFTTELASFGREFHPQPSGGHDRNPWTFSPDGSRLALRTQVVLRPGGGGLKDPQGVTIEVWDIAGGKRAASLNVDGQVSDLAFSPDGKKLAGFGWGLDSQSRRVPFLPKGPVRTFLWEGADGTELKEVRSTPVLSLKTSIGRGRQGLAYSPDGRLLAVNMGLVLCLIDAATGEEKRVSKTLGEAARVRFGDGGKLLHAVIYHGHDNPTWYEWDLSTSPVQDTAGPEWQRQKEVTVRSRNGERQARYVPSGTKEPISITIRDCEGKVLRTLTPKLPVLKSVAFSPNGRFLLSYSQDHWTPTASGVLVKESTQVWDLETGKTPLSYPGGFAHDLRLGHSPDGTIHNFGGGGDPPLSASPDGQLVILQNDSGIAVVKFDEARELFSIAGADAVHFSHDSRWLVTGHTKVKKHSGLPGQIGGFQHQTIESYEIKVWDVKTGKQVRAHNSSDTRIAISRDGHCFLAQKRGDEEVVLLDVGTGETSFTLRGKGPFQDFSEMVFSPDRTMLVTRCKWAEFRVWDLVHHRELFTFLAGVGSFDQLAFTPDSKRLAQACVTNATSPEVKLWDCATGSELLRFVLPRADDSNGPISFTPDGHRLVWSFVDSRFGSITRTWDATPREEPQR